MIDVFIVASLAIVLVAGSVRVAIEIYVRRRAYARRAAEQAERPSIPEALSTASVAEPALPVTDFAADLAADPAADPAAPREAQPPVARFSVEMGPHHPLVCIAVGGRTIPVEIQPWQAVELARALLAAGAACAPGAQPPLEGTMFP